MCGGSKGVDPEICEGESARRCRGGGYGGQRGGGDAVWKASSRGSAYVGVGCACVCFVAPLVSGLLTCRSWAAASMPGTQHGNNDLLHRPSTCF